MEKLILIDGNSLLNRAFYATPVFTTKDGLPTNGVFGFVKLLLKIIGDKKPTHAAVAFDVHAPTFRHNMYADYKAGRKPMPDDLGAQFPILKEVLRIMNVAVFEKVGFEADDIIGTLAKRFQIPTYIYTGDRDAYQLVDDTTTVCFTRKGVSDILELTNENFTDEIGLTPSQIIDLKAFMGDKSDHIPGIAGVGEKTAVGLLQKYGDTEGVYVHLDEIKGALHDKLQNGKEDAYFSKQLATIDVNAPIDATLTECLLTIPFPSALRTKFSELEFKSLLSKESIFADDDEDSLPVQTENTRWNLVERTPDSVQEVLGALKDMQSSRIACYLADDCVQIAVFSKENEVTEYHLPVAMGLLDVGFFDYQLQPLLQHVFEGKIPVISYNSKEVMHRLNRQEIKHLAPFDDVSILKCLADGLSNSDGLDFCLQYHALNEKNKAYGLLWLYYHYFGALRTDEKKLYTDVELPLVRVLFDMERQGVCIDEKTLNALSKRYADEINDLTQKIYMLAGQEFNINSTQQLGSILFDKLKIGDGAKKNKVSKSYKTTAEELEKYADEEIVRYILRYRKIQKLRSTYIEGFKPLIYNGKVHTTYNQTFTLTGRLSSANPNLQNIPIRTEEGRELRKLFKASENHVLIDADYSQIELRLLAHFSNCKELCEAYNEGRDIHAITASQVFNVPLENVTSDMRREAKAVNFGIIYGISAYGLATDLHISAKRAQEYIDRYFESYSDVKTYINGNVEKAQKDGYVETLLGRRRVINELRSSNYNVRSFGERAAMNMPLQGSSADIIKLAMLGVFNGLNKGNFKAKLVLQVHDELVIDCPKDEIDEVKALLKREMENAVALNVPLTVEVGVGENWYESK